MKFLDNFLKKFTHDIGIDLGTANTLVSLSGYGLVIDEPSIVAINKETKEVLAVGEEARHMIGRTPANIVSINPMADGVITDFDTTEAMIRYFIQKVYHDYPKRFQIMRPRVVIGIPSTITEVEIRAVVDAAVSAGARKVYLIEEPMAAAIGAGLPIEDASGSMIVDIGGGTTDIAVISYGGIIIDNSIKIGGDEMDIAIVEYVKHKYNLLIGIKMGEDLKIQLATTLSSKKKQEVEIKGRDIVTGLPNSVRINTSEVREAILPVIDKIVFAVKDAVEKIPPEIISDLLDRGVFMTGGGALIEDIDKYFESHVKFPFVKAHEPLRGVVKGTELLLDEIDLLEKVKFNHEEII
jgi:rod shape-determining protein MreB and related proteins